MIYGRFQNSFQFFARCVPDRWPGPSERPESVGKVFHFYTLFLPVTNQSRLQQQQHQFALLRSQFYAPSKPCTTCQWGEKHDHSVERARVWSDVGRNMAPINSRNKLNVKYVSRSLSLHWEDRLGWSRYHTEKMHSIRNHPVAGT